MLERKRSIWAILLAALIGAAGGAAVVHFVGHAPHAEHAAGAQKYHCPMHPTVVQDEPGNCPICGMKLVPVDAKGGDAAAADEPPKAATKYQCPMHPAVVQDEPGNCPICGMKLVPMKTDDAPAGHGGHAGHGSHGGRGAGGLVTVNIDPQRQQLIGLRTAEVTRGPVGGSWRTVGRVAVDETRVRHVNVKVAGFVEHVHVDFVGKSVRKGDALFSMYSPDLVSAQNEYLLALQTRQALRVAGSSGTGDALVESARRRLKLWDVTDAEITELERTGAPRKSMILHSPIAGVVTTKEIVEGASLNVGDMPYEIVDLSTVWVLADVYDTELRRVRIGMPATLTLKALPGRTFSGKVIFVDPILDPQTRTAKVRIEFRNPGNELKPELFGEVVLETPAREALRIPADAVIPTGTKNVVFVSVGEGKFAPREVTVGASDGETVEVTEGLELGEKVVIRASFLVDSESRLRASLQAMSGGTP